LFAIRAEGLSKRYRILRPLAADAESSRASRGARALRRAGIRWPSIWSRRTADDLWALKDVTFDVQPGEILGIIGRNGAGKSTLLKIFGRITRPTQGQARLRGRVSALLEVGTGFHPELTGMENIFLGGSIFGMTRREIRRKLDEIVAFAEIEPFLETPVKRYSSGMYMRLAFSVAAHLEPEILIVDEVLAVGDVAFQKKCLSRMESLSGHNRTVLFVSHHLGAIRQLCPRCLLLEQGQLVQDGKTPDVVAAYNRLLRDVTVDVQTALTDRLSRGTVAVRFTDVSVENAAGQKVWDFSSGETIRIRFSYRVFKAVSDLKFFFALRSNTHAETLTTASEVLSAQPLAPEATGSHVLEIVNNILRPGDYSIYCWLGSQLGVAYDHIDTQNASLPPLTVWSDETDPHKTIGFFTMQTRLLPADPEDGATR
jgi:homopolymeric O-antigen transport system ATP-binding protein